MLRSVGDQRPPFERAAANGTHKAKLRELLIAADDHVLRYSEEFSDPVKLLEAANKQGLEGIVSKLSYQPYRSGKNPGWIKVKCRAWREANRDSWEMFER